MSLLLTGLSGAGKTALARELAWRWERSRGRPMTVLDGDEVRELLSWGLGFSRQDRGLHLERMAFVASEIARHGGIAVIAAIAPYADDRGKAMGRLRSHGSALMVHVSTPLAACERRDSKGLYARARKGELAGLTGLDSPYEAPLDADLTLDLSRVDLSQACHKVESLIETRIGR